MRMLVWLIRAAIFFTLFAFALNNQQEAGVRWFFGQEWRAPMGFIVLAAFALGCALGVFAMVPSWWRHRRGGCAQRCPGGRSGDGHDGALREQPRDHLAAPASRWTLIPSGCC